MRREHRTTATTAADTSPMAYQLTEDAHLVLVQTRDQLRLLARLTEPHAAADDEERPLSPLALAHCFERLARELDGVVEAVHWPTGLTCSPEPRAQDERPRD